MVSSTWCVRYLTGHVELSRLMRIATYRSWHDWMSFFLHGLHLFDAHQHFDANIKQQDGTNSQVNFEEASTFLYLFGTTVSWTARAANLEHLYKEPKKWRPGLPGFVAAKWQPLVPKNLDGSCGSSIETPCQKYKNVFCTWTNFGYIHISTLSECFLCWFLMLSTSKSSWWFQPSWKILVKMGIFPK